MKWEELDYFFSLLKWGSILDIWCGSGRLIEQYSQYFSKEIENYFWADMSSWLIDEAKKAFPSMEFWVWNMLDIKDILDGKTFENIFLIASFHHLETLAERESMMKILYTVCKPGGRIFMTNWALNSDLNKKRYSQSQIPNSLNEFQSLDFSIKIWSSQRFYHSFSLRELEYLSELWWFKIIENRLFDNDKNIITILKK